MNPRDVNLMGHADHEKPQFLSQLSRSFYVIFAGHSRG